MRWTTSSGVLLVALAAAGLARAQSGVLSSQLGYDIDDPKRVIVRSSDARFLSPRASFVVLDAAGEEELVGCLEQHLWQWHSAWWVADISHVRKAGTYSVVVKDRGHVVLTSDPIEVRDHPLWRACYRTIAFDFLAQRARQARTKKGWRDCGSDLQEFSSHAVAVDSLCDVLEHGEVQTTPTDRARLQREILRGCEYLAHLQDKAATLGVGDGAVIHEDRQTDVVTGNVAKAAMVFARASRLAVDAPQATRAEYIERAVRAFRWIHRNGPIVNDEEQDFYPYVHGAPAGSVPPADQWMTRDLATMVRAAVELYRAGREEFRQAAVEYARRLTQRQVSSAEREDGLYGHFYTYDDFSSFGGERFTEKANIHCGAWSKEGRIYNKGGHYPHYLIGLIDMIRLWPDHPQASRWRRCVRAFAYGYFRPACRRSPFLILPSGHYRGEGLLYFSSWYHGHSNIYAFAASLALEFERFFDDPEFREIALGNLQWIAGLNCGLAEKVDGQLRYVPVSLIAGIGPRWRGSWTKIPGSICNGFSASPQFRITPARAETDWPSHFDDEAYIAHSLPYLAALARLEAMRARDHH